jgi:hypothetical protein
VSKFDVHIMRNEWMKERRKKGRKEGRKEENGQVVKSNDFLCNEQIRAPKHTLHRNDH